MPGKKTESIHLASMPDVNKDWIDEGLEKKWGIILSVKVEASKALETARQQKVIGHPLDALVTIIPTKELASLLKEEEDALEEVLIVSDLKVSAEGSAPAGGVLFESKEVPGLKITVEAAGGGKCERCWHFSPFVGKSAEHPTICDRCVEALK